MITATHLHAMAVHFPIALLLLGFLSEILSLIFPKKLFDSFAFFLLLTGTLGTIISYFAGNAAGAGIEGGTLGKAIELHEQAGTIALWVTISTALFYLIIFFLKLKKGWIKIIGILFYLFVIIVISRTGYLGGQLVYKHGAGVEMALPDFSNPEEN